MIAPLREPQTSSQREPAALRAARRAVAATLLRPTRDALASGAPVPAWQAWAMTAWGALVVGYWSYTMWSGW